MDRKQIRELGCMCLIIGTTGNMIPKDVKFFKDNGTDEILRKPSSIDRFETALRNFKEEINFIKIWIKYQEFSTMV